MTSTLPLLGRAALLFGISLGAWAQPAPAPQAPPEAPTAASHVARARQYAGEDLRNLMPLCLPQPAARAAPGAAMDDQLRKLIARPAPPPMQVFDNLYFVGGGTSFNFGKDFSRLESYSANAARMETIAGRLPVDVLLSNHSSWDGSIPKMNALRSAAPGASNPFVSNPGTVGRAFLVMNECAQAQARRFGY